MACLRAVLELELADNEGRPFVRVSVLKGLKQLHPVPDPRHSDLAHFEAVEGLNEGDHSFEREESEVLLVHRQGVVNGYEDLVVSL